MIFSSLLTAFIVVPILELWLLLTPGLITDAAGFLLLVPPVRVLIRGWLRCTLEKKCGRAPLHSPFASS